MKNFSYILFFLLFTISACKKDDNTYRVSYKIVETSLSPGSYSVRYSMPDGTLKSEGPINTDTWLTADMTGYKKNTIVSFYLDASGGSYEMIIYVNGEVNQQANAYGGMGEQLLEARVPN